VSERKGGEWGKPENLGPAVNTTANEGFPFMALDGKLYFCSKGHPGYGGFDIFVTYKDENGAWQPATNLGKPINSPLDDISIYLAADQRSGYFTSSRSGGDDDIYLFKVLDEAPSAPASELPPIAETQLANPEAAEPAPVLDEAVKVLPPTPVVDLPEQPIVEEEAPRLPPNEEATTSEPEPIPPVTIEAPSVEAESDSILPEAKTMKPVETPVLEEEPSQVPTVGSPPVTIRVEMPVAQHQAPTSTAPTDVASATKNGNSTNGTGDDTT
jgi:hypothetical protein